MIRKFNRYLIGNIKLLKNIDKTLLITSLFLFILGLVMVFSASNVTSFMKLDSTPYHFFNKQLIFLVAGLFAALIVIGIKTKHYGWLSTIGTVVIIILLIILLAYGEVTNQAKSWIEIGGLKLQPSEFAKVISIVWIATFCARITKENIVLKSLLLCTAIGLTAILIVFQPDLGTAIIYLSAPFLMFFLTDYSKKSKWIVFGLLILGIIIVGIFLVFAKDKILAARQASRLDFSEPCSEEKFYTTGTQLCNGYIAINNGGLFGKGLGNSTQKYLYLPEAYTDFIFAIVVEELGFIPSAGILLLIFIVLWRVFLIGKRSTTKSGKLMCYGIFWYILIHVFVNLGGITGLIPLTGVPLPFLSYGGSYLLCLIMSLTIVQRVNIETKLKVKD